MMTKANGSTIYRHIRASTANGRTVNMTGAEIGIILLVIAYLLHFIVFAAYTAQTDMEINELRHRVTMLEMRKDGGDGSTD